MHSKITYKFLKLNVFLFFFIIFINFLIYFLIIYVKYDMLYSIFLS